MSLKSQHARGFTLIELLTVMVIFAVIASFATLSISNDPHRVIENSAKRFVQQFSLISEEAALHAIDYGLRIDEENYSYWHWDQLQWQQPKDPMLAQKMSFPPELDVELIMDQATTLALDAGDNINGSNDLFEDDENKIEEPPQILLLSSGEVTPFILQLRSVNTDNYIELKFDALGRSSVERIDVN